jgi:hypothetical protein
MNATRLAYRAAKAETRHAEQTQTHFVFGRTDIHLTGHANHTRGNGFNKKPRLCSLLTSSGE